MFSLLTPTRNRPEGVRRLIQSVCDTADSPVEFVFYVDDDAPYEPHVLKAPQKFNSKVTVKSVVGPRITLSDTWNKCADLASGDIFMQCDDDVAFRSQGWDTKIRAAIEAYKDRLLVVWGRDGVHPPPNCATQLFVHRRWTEILGYFTPPYFSSDWSDTWIYDLGVKIGRTKFLDDVYTEHLHPIAGKAEWDQTYLDRLSRHTRDNVEQIFKNREPERAADALKLKAAMLDD